MQSLEVDPFRVVFTTAELATLAALENLELPDQVLVLSPRAGEELPPDPARIEEALASLVARGYLMLSQDDSYITPALASLLSLLCSPEWSLDGIRVARGREARLYHVSGRGEAGVLVEGSEPDAVRFVYRPDARDHLVATALATEQPSETKLDHGAATTLVDLQRRDDWGTRTTCGVSVVHGECAIAVEWIIVGGSRFKLSQSPDGVVASPLDALELHEAVSAAIAAAIPVS